VNKKTREILTKDFSLRMRERERNEERDIRIVYIKKKIKERKRVRKNMVKGEKKAGVALALRCSR